MINFEIKNTKEFYASVGYFLTIMVGVFFITFSVLYFLGLTPGSFSRPDRDINDEIDESYWVGDYELIDVSGYAGGQSGLISRTLPDRVVIDKIGVDTIVEQPNTRDVQVLDQYLTRGAVYYPGSGTLEQGNMFIFGHSTGLSVVQNQAYKTFNNLENLVEGDEIRVEADGSIYIYRVTDVSLYNADEAVITFDNSSRKLTLSTCNTFGAKQERWVVDADFYREI
jgi:LPXTG-site transpeptidase (sortase) family protein